MFGEFSAEFHGHIVQVGFQHPLQLIGEVGRIAGFASQGGGDLHHDILERCAVLGVVAVADVFQGHRRDFDLDRLHLTEAGDVAEANVDDGVGHGQFVDDDFHQFRIRVGFRQGVHDGFEIHLAIGLLEHELRLLDDDLLDANGLFGELAVVDQNAEVAHLEHVRRGKALG